LSIDSTKCYALTVGKFVHCRQRKVDPGGRSIDTEDEDALALVCNFVACAALRVVPSGNLAAAANVWERWDGALGLPTVS
jgi:hypothetical protein